MSGHHGSCHCGAVQIALVSALVEVTECNCSLCRRLGSLWHYGPLGSVQVEGEVVGYVQGDRTLTTWRCAHCGCVTHWTAVDRDYDRMGVNLRMFDPALWRNLPRKLVDGASY